jgi:hypothetical protein
LFCFREKKHRIEMTAKVAPKLLGRFHAPCELPLPAVSWEPVYKKVQKAEYRDFIDALPRRISAVQQLGDFATEFVKTQLALFVFHSNRPEGAIAPDHIDGRIVAAISAYLDGSSPEPRGAVGFEGWPRAVIPLVKPPAIPGLLCGKLSASGERPTAADSRSDPRDAPPAL